MLTVNGQWSSWTNWTECSATCDNGTKTRNRNCTSPPPSYGGVDCSDRPPPDNQTHETINCVVRLCPGKLAYQTCAHIHSSMIYLSIRPSVRLSIHPFIRPSTIYLKCCNQGYIRNGKTLNIYKTVKEVRKLYPYRNCKLHICHPLPA